jgi:hypothetical protein
MIIVSQIPIGLHPGKCSYSKRCVTCVVRQEKSKVITLPPSDGSGNDSLTRRSIDQNQGPFPRAIWIFLRVRTYVTGGSEANTFLYSLIFEKMYFTCKNFYFEFRRSIFPQDVGLQKPLHLFQGYSEVLHISFTPL